MNFTGTSEYITSLKGKEVTLVFSGGDDITGTLKDICVDTLIMSSGERIAVCCIDKIMMICEGSWHKGNEDDTTGKST